MEQTVSDFLSLLRVPISKKYVEKLIASHPDFPSLLSVSDVLQRLGIDHVARRIAQKDLIDVPCPHLLPLDKGRGDMLLIKNEHDLTSHKNDLELWGGVVLQAEASKQTSDKTNNDLYSKEVRIRNFTIGLLITASALLLLPFFSSFSLISFTLLFTALSGGVVGYFLLAKELDVTYAAIDAFCNAGKNTNCDRVLDAEINLLGIKFSDAVVSYFLFQLVALAFAQALPEIKSSFTQVLVVLSALTTPIILFSLYYQYFVAKTWCRLCLVVVAILIVQFAIFTGDYFNGAIQSFSSLSYGVPRISDR